MSETLTSDVVFSNLENILNYSNIGKINPIEVVWARKKNENELTGFIKIDNRVVPFEASYDGVELTVWIWIEGKWFGFEFNNEEIAKVIEWVKQQ